MTAIDVLKALDENQRGILLNDTPIDLIVKGIQVYNRALFVRYFKGYRLQILGRKRARQLLDTEAIGKANDELAQLFFTLWNRANGRLYNSMYNKVRTVNEDVDKIEKIDDEQAEVFINELLEDFDQDRVYMCILFNEVKFSKDIIAKALGRTIPFEKWPPEPHKEEEEGEGGGETEGGVAGGADGVEEQAETADGDQAKE